ncbi:TetR/AcrR family transcriptional regulator [Schumannella soli]|uniref:TetR/AcrR family transcriptional regulator n=2 Tax=Schumannella soli TaxID=2590779 RepID=A0A506XZU3_9MICO|nr:TetR/AcrR family transcriptional regulator [Schumannella soli]
MVVYAHGVGRWPGRDRSGLCRGDARRPPSVYSHNGRNQNARSGNKLTLSEHARETPMPRRPDPNRKQELLEQIIEYLLGSSLAGMTFRTLADALGVSTYSLVYHFGTRAELVQEIVRAITGRQQELLDAHPPTTASLESYLEGFASYWQQSQSERNRRLRRLEIEAAMVEALDPESIPIVRTANESYRAAATESLVTLGLGDEDARREAGVMMALVYGMQLDAVLTGETERVNENFALALDQFRARIEAHRAAIAARETTSGSGVSKAAAAR